jgi:hypothetical protein
MSATDVTKTIQDALAAEQIKPNPFKGEVNRMSMNNPYQPNQEMNQGGTQPLQKIPTQFNVYDPNTGRNWTEDASGRRVFNRQPITGTQLVNINSRITQFNKVIARFNEDEKAKIPFLNDHNVRSMSIDSASLMIDTYAFINSQLEMIVKGFDAYIAQQREEYEKQVEVLKNELDSALKDPKVAAELVKIKQAEDAKKTK